MTPSGEVIKEYMIESLLGGPHTESNLHHIFSCFESYSAYSCCYVRDHSQLIFRIGTLDDVEESGVTYIAKDSDDWEEIRKFLSMIEPMYRI